MDLLARIRRARAVARRQGDAIALARLDALEARRRRHPAASTVPRTRHVPLARAALPAWFAEDDEWELETTAVAGPVGRSRGRRGSGPAPTTAELDAELLILDAQQRAHEARLAHLGRPRRPTARRERRRPIHVSDERRELVVRAARGLIAANRRGCTEVVDRDVRAAELVVKAAIGRLAGDRDAGREAFGSGFFREIPLTREQHIEATAKYLRAHWSDVEARADELEGKGFHPGTRSRIPAPISFAGLNEDSYWRGSLK